MVMRVQRLAGELCVVLSAEALRSLQVAEGAEVEVLSVGSEAEVNGPIVRYLSNEDALDLYQATLGQHRSAYQELAK